MVEKHTIKVDDYKRKVPTHYRDHEGEVLAYVPEGSKYAKDPRSRVHR